jgi:regulator of replication initiation timing
MDKTNPAWCECAHDVCGEFEQLRFENDALKKALANAPQEAYYANHYRIANDNLAKQLEAVTAERDELREALQAEVVMVDLVAKERDELRRDAERYLFLQKWLYVEVGCLEIGTNIPCHRAPNKADIDAAIDAAMKESEK